MAVTKKRRNDKMFLLKGCGDITQHFPPFNMLGFPTLDLALLYIEQHLYQHLDLEDDRLIIFEIMPDSAMHVVWHFSGWHFSCEDVILPQGCLLNKNIPLCDELRMEDSL